MPNYSQHLQGKVLVLGEDTRSFLTSVRSFGRAGLSVHTAWGALNAPALRSKYVFRDHRLPLYRPGETGWLDAFCELLWKEKFDFVLPCTDHIILPLQLHRETVLSAGRVNLLPDDVYWTCASKAKTHALAAELGIPVPVQTTAHDQASLRQAATELGYPLVLKPETSSIASNPGHRRTAVKARTPDELDQLGAELLGSGPILAQQNVIGGGVGVEFLAKDGVILTAFQHERVHEMPNGGLSGYRRSVPLDPGMYRAAALLAKSLNYTGLAMVEFKRDPRGGWVLIEINARVWGSLPLSVAAGIDFPRYLYEMLVLNRTEFPKQYRKYLYCRHWTSDVEWLRANAAADRADPNLLVTPYHAIASELGIVLTLRERSDTFQIDDLAPAMVELHQFLARKTFALLKRTKPYRQSLGHRAIKAFHGARSVLFVCYGNICRSPFAERRLKQLRPELTVTSSGFHSVVERASPAAAIEAASGFGVDLSGHRSSELSSSLLEAADIVFVFDAPNREDMGRRFAGVAPKVHFLGGLDPDGALEVDDPYGSSVKQFNVCYARIDRALRALTGAAT
jgi:protein-tyrosine-phosphatase/predicted ATP-grasp superfamily ATP-dependent carboligase